MASFLTSPYSHTVAERVSCTKLPISLGKAQGGGTILPDGMVANRVVGSPALDQPELINSGGFSGSRYSDCFQDSSFDRGAFTNKFPKGDKQFPCQGNHDGLTATDSARTHTCLEPTR
jgi:hypothetical protein